MTELQRPGAGLPWPEAGLLNLALKTSAAFSSDRRILNVFQKESAELTRLINDDESYDVFQPLLIPRLIGIEESSRNWSVAMVLEHLCLVNAELTIAVSALAKGIVPKGEVDIAYYKPDSDLSFDVVDRFQETNQRYVDMMESLLEIGRRLPTHPTSTHPWFGQLSAHQWHYLAAAHQTIHRRQAQKIIAMLGVT